jgi:hypothetical protein
MLGVKSTSKDRWRQVLTESAFIPFRRDEADETKTTPHPPARKIAVCAPHLIRPAATFSPARRRNLEAGISAKQTDEMRRQSLTLVVPTGLPASEISTPHPNPLPGRGGEGEAQRTGLLSVAESVEFVRGKQTP